MHLNKLINKIIQNQLVKEVQFLIRNEYSNRSTNANKLLIIIEYFSSHSKSTYINN